MVQQCINSKMQHGSDIPSSAGVKRVALWIAILGGFVTPFMGSSINIALPSIGREFSLHAVGLNWVATSYLLAAAMFLLPFGKLADIYGRKKIYALGTGCYALTTFLCAIAGSGFTLILFRALQGVTGAMVFGTGAAILTSVYPIHERGKAFGLSIASTYLGLSLGPVLGGFMTQYLGWRSIFVVVGIICCLGCILTVWKLKGEWAEAKDEAFDLTGSALYSFALVAVIYGLSRLPSRSGVIFIASAALLLIFFLRFESRAAFPVLDVKLFQQNRIFTFSSLAALINYSATYAVGFLLSLYLQIMLGMSPQKAGLILIVQPLFMTAFSPLAGRLSDRVEARIVASAGMAITAIGLLGFLMLNARTSLFLIIACLVFIGLGFAFFSSPNTNAVMSSVEKRFYGVASATLATMRLTGQMLSMALTMLIMALYLGSQEPFIHQSQTLFLSSMHSTFIVFSVLCLIGVFASLARGQARRR